MNYYFGVFKKYAVFDGRASRSEYWYFTLFNLLVSILVMIAFSVVRLSGSMIGGFIVGVISFLYSVGSLIPSLAVGIRRLHDTNRSGWWVLISLVPLVGTIWLLVLLVLDSTLGENEYGSNPKMISAK